MTREEFLWAAVKSAALVGLGAAGYGVFNKATSGLVRKHDLVRNKRTGIPNYSMAIDITKCIGCGLCVEACSKENNVPLGHYRTWIERYVVKKDGTILIDSPEGGIGGFPDSVPESEIERSFFVPKLCNHCEASPCTQVCPVGATFRSEEGVVLVDYDYCIGCRYCIQACPYGSRFWNPGKKTADKCTLCYHRITNGKLPACVEVCPVEARVFGDLNDPESPVSRFVHDNQTMVMKPHLKTGAKVAYKGLSKEVV
jgi:Fe-S-cluster-containing dehydrogenase component